MAFDIQAAKNAGYSPADIAGFLAAQNNFDLGAAKNAGYSDDEVIRHLTGASVSTGVGRTVLDQTLQGATANFGDEITGTIGGLGAKLYDVINSRLRGEEPLFNEPIGDTLAAGRDLAAANVRAQQEERPILSGVSQIGGALVPAVGVAKYANKIPAIARAGKAVQESGRIAKASASAGVGAGYGAAYGAGAGTEGTRASGAAKGAGYGGAFGAVLPAAAGATKGVANTVRRAIGGRSAEEVLASRMGDATPEALMQRLFSASPSTTIADVGGDSLRALTRTVAKASPEARNIVADALETRALDAPARVSSQVARRVSGVGDYFGSLDELAQARKQLSAPLYAKAYQEGAQIDREGLKPLLMDQRIVDAVNKAKAEYGVRAEAPVNSLETLDGAKKVLDDIIGSAMQAGQRQKAASYLALKGQLVETLDSVSPSYAEARKVFGDFSSLQNAQERGLKFDSLQPEEIRRAVSKMTPVEADAFRIGVRESLQRKVNAVADGADPAKRIFGNQQKRNQLKAVFGDNRKAFEQFSQRMRDEIAGADTKFKVIGGSRTDYNQADETSALIDGLQTFADAGPKGLLNKAVNTALDYAQIRYAGLNSQNAEELARILTDKKQGLAALDRLISKNTAPAQKAILRRARQGLADARAEYAAFASSQPGDRNNGY
jgi:hypothetical protein